MKPSRRRFLAMLLAGAGAASVRAEARPLRFGLTPVVLDDQIGFLHDWAAWLGRQLARPVSFVQRSRYREIMDLLLTGRLDLAWICGYPYIAHQDRLPLLAVPYYQGRPRYRSYLIVSADSEWRSLADLKGRLFAWADPDSNSGYLFPRYHLVSDGWNPDRFFGRTFFTWGHPRSVEAVAEGLVDGAAVDSYVWDTLARRDPSVTARTRVILESPEFGFPPLVAGPHLPASEREHLRRVLIGQVQDPVGRRLLTELNLDTFSIETPDLYRGIAEMADRLNRLKQ